MKEAFEVVGIRPYPKQVQQIKKEKQPIVSIVVFISIVLGCLFIPLFLHKDATNINLYTTNLSPNTSHLFGTDTLGRDIFSLIWIGGRISLTIGILSTIISTILAIIIGTTSACAPKYIDTLIMRSIDILLSIPSLLLILFLQAIIGTTNILTLSIIIGITSWTTISKVIRTEVIQLKQSEYVIASKCMGASFWYVLYKHLLPNFISSIMFMVIMNVRNAIVIESTLSFMGMGLPLEMISWGTMLSEAEKALLTNSWWIILIPGIFLITTLLCMTNIGSYMRKQSNRKESNL